MVFSTRQFTKEATGRLGSSARMLGWQAVIPVVLGLLFACGDQAIAGKGTIDVSDYEFYQRIVVSVALFVGGFAVANHLLVVRPALARAAHLVRASQLGGQPASATISDSLAERHRGLDFGWDARSVVLGALIVLLCWMVYIACLYPGTMWYDTSWQVYEHLSGTLSDHHPFMLVYLYGLFIDMGIRLFDNGAAGMFVLICIQMVAASVGLSLMCCYMRRLGARWGVCLAALLLFGLFPYLPMTFNSIVKDTLQATLLVYFVLLFLEVVRTRGEFLRHAWVPIAMLVLGLAICVTKKTGVYMIAPALLATVFMRLKNGGRVLMPVMGVFLLVFMLGIVSRLIMPALNVEPGGKQEMLAVPIQQVAHEYKEYRDGNSEYAGAFTKEDEQLLNDFLTVTTDQIVTDFDYTIVDPIKDGALRDDSLIPEFMRLWARLGAQHPVGHLEAWSGMEAGWFSFTPQITVKVASGTIANNDFVSQYVTWPDSDIKNDFVTSLYNLVGDIPGVNLLYSQALWATVLPFFALFVVLRARRPQRWGRLTMLIGLSPYLMTVVTLFICPVSTGVEVARYILPMVVMAPLMLTYAICGTRQDDVETIEGDQAETLARALSTVTPIPPARVAAEVAVPDAAANMASPSSASAADAEPSPTAPGVPSAGTEPGPDEASAAGMLVEQAGKGATVASHVPAGTAETTDDVRAAAPTEDKPAAHAEAEPEQGGAAAGTGDESEPARDQVKPDGSVPPSAS